MNKEWIDFSLPKNQVVARFWDSPDDKVKTKFFHQLLLAIELHLRIQHKDHYAESKRSVLSSLPPKVSWDLALAQRWLENVGIEQETITSHDSEFRFELHSKRRQKNALKHFARLLKWPNMQEVEFTLEENDRRSGPIEEKTSETMCWFTGVILPGPTLPFILMNSLIDCDEDTNNQLQYLTHVNPSCGFQYRANTYWSYKCILGKVLGASRGVKQISGWIGPCQFSPDLGRAQCLLIDSELPPQFHPLTKEDIIHMDLNTDVLGPEDLDDYYVRDFDIPSLPDTFYAEETIRIQKLAFFEIDDSESRDRKKGAKLHEAAVVFAAAGNNIPLRLRYDVDFVNTPPCENGPHPLFHTYKTHFTRVEDGLRDMAGLNGEFVINTNRNTTMGSRGDATSLMDTDAASQYYTNDWHHDSESQAPRRPIRGFLPSSEETEEPTLVVDASGVTDNEVFARAWCAHWGEHAIIANLKETCISCAVRAAYAAKVRVVIVTEGGRDIERDQGVCDLMSTVG
jgi:hypothetical protein